MKVGAIEETITVSGETPIVDTQSVRRQVTVSNDVIASMPAARSYAGVMMLIPATTTQAGANLDIQVTPGMLVFGGAGGRTNEARIQVDGLNTGAAFNGAGVSSYVVGHRQRAGNLDDDLGRPRRSRSRRAVVQHRAQDRRQPASRAAFYASNVTRGMVGDNYTQDLKNAGLTTPGKLYKLWDYNVGVGGPIKKDRVWYLLPVPRRGQPPHGARACSPTRTWAIPTKWTYVKDTSRPAVTAGSWRNASLRMTVQPTARNKFNSSGISRSRVRARAFSDRRRMPSVGRRRDHLRRARRLESAVHGDHRA